MIAKEICAIITARSGSKGVKGKNIKNLCGKPLLAYTIEASLRSKFVKRTVLSTDSKEIADVGRKYGAEIPFLRPKSLAKDDTPALPVIKHTLEKLKNKGYEPEIILVLMPTCPLRTSKHIDEALEKIINTPDADSIVSIMSVPHNFNPYSIYKDLRGEFLTPFLPWDERKNLRALKPEFYARNGAIYAFTRKCFYNKNSMFGEKILYYLMEERESLDIDTIYDFELAELTMGRNDSKED